MSKIDLYKGDCLEVMDELIAKEVKFNCIATDIPYGEVSKNGAERAKYGGATQKYR